MWLITTIGFFSVVQKPGDRVLTVRARVEGDLDRLRERYLPSLGPTIANAGTDYPYRATVEREALALAMAELMRDVDYANFKDAVAEAQGHARARTYHDVWATLTRLERR